MAADTLAVILAAGAGTRLRPLTDSPPKCLLEVGGRPLLDYQLEALAAVGISEVLVVTGFEAEQLQRRYGGRVRFVHNPNYASTNNLHSLRVAAREIAGRDALCLHADVLFDSAILRPCLESREDVSVILDRVLNEETMKARVEGNRVVEISKNVSRRDAFGTFLGLARFSPKASGALEGVLDRLTRDNAHRQSYFVACLPFLAERGFTVGYVLTEGRSWVEIDTEADLARASGEILPLLGKGPS